MVQWYYDEDGSEIFNGTHKVPCYFLTEHNVSSKENVMGLGLKVRATP